jgi:hypothetical protein
LWRRIAFRVLYAPDDFGTHRGLYFLSKLTHYGPDGYLHGYLHGKSDWMVVEFRGWLRRQHI